MAGHRGYAQVGPTLHGLRAGRPCAPTVRGRALANIGPAVSIFGSAHTDPSDPYYALAEQVAAGLVGPAAR